MVSNQFEMLQVVDHGGIKVTVCGKSWENEAAWKASKGPSSVTATSDGRMVNRSEWCQCAAPNLHDNEVYYADLITGAHGWACGSCRKITQTG